MRWEAFNGRGATRAGAQPAAEAPRALSRALHGQAGFRPETKARTSVGPECVAEAGGAETPHPGLFRLLRLAAEPRAALNEADLAALSSHLQLDLHRNQEAAVLLGGFGLRFECGQDAVPCGLLRRPPTATRRAMRAGEQPAACRSPGRPARADPRGRRTRACVPPPPAVSEVQGTHAPPQLRFPPATESSCRPRAPPRAREQPRFPSRRCRETPRSGAAPPSVRRPPEHGPQPPLPAEDDTEHRH